MMEVEVLTNEQGSHEWHQDRAGAITASMFSEVRRTVGGLDDRQQSYVNWIRGGMDKANAAKNAGYKNPPKSDKVDRAIDGESVGDWSETAHNYAFRLAIERISGEPLQDEKYQGYAAQRGHQLEPEARELHAFTTDQLIERAGVIRSLDGKFGCSADGLIGDTIGVEYKCFTSVEKIRPILFDFDVQDVRDQMQGGMWLSGRQEWQFGLYCPFLDTCNRALTLITEKRDDEYIAHLERDLLNFDELVESYKSKLENSYD